MTYIPPLQIHLLFHPASDEARGFAEELVRDLIAGPAMRGLQAPVFLTPDRGDGLPPRLSMDDLDRFDLDSAQHTVVVVLADARMQRRVMGGTGQAWAEFVLSLLNSHDPTRHSVLLISLDQQGVQLDESLAGKNFIVVNEQDPSARRAEVAFHLGVRALILLRERNVEPKLEGPRATAPVKFFLSHAKADLDKDRKGPVHRVLEETAALPVQQWYDAKDIEPAVEFSEAIRTGINDADLMVVFLTDSWAKSEWCRMEAMCAKEVGTPILMVDALKDGEPRSFPYGGNVRSVRWPLALDNTNSSEVVPKIDDQQLRSRAAFRLINAAVQETLARLHSQRLIEEQALDGDVSLDTAPEAVHLAIHPEAKSFLYPDPPLTVEEVKLLKALRPNATFETPLMRTAARLKLQSVLMIAVSMSDSDVLARYGLTNRHLQTITDEIHLYLLVAGLRIAYGGKLDPDKLSDPDNFTLRLFNLVSGCHKVARDVGVKLKPILNVAPWPLWKLYDDRVLNLFGTKAELETVDCPDLGFPLSDLQPLPNGFVKPDTPLRQYAWGPAMTAMRTKLTNETFARITIGGKIEGYKGRYAGLIEEPLLSLRSKKPLYLVGALGGCTRLVIDLLEQRTRTEMSTSIAREKTENYDEIVALYAKYGQEFLSREDIAIEIRKYGANGPAIALNNGLSDQENRELFKCAEPRRIAELILTGLAKLVGM